MQDNDTRRHVRLGTLNVRQLAALTAALAPYRSQRITAPIVEQAKSIAVRQLRTDAYR